MRHHERACERAISQRTARVLRSHARHIQQLGRRAIRDIVEIGRRLTDAKRLLGHGRFLCWLAAEFGWSGRSAERFMRVFELAHESDKLSDLGLPVSAFYLLAAPSTPDAAIEEVASRAGNGNGLSLAEVKDIIASSRRASPIRELVRIAKEIMREVEKMPIEQVPSAIERHTSELPDDQGDGVKNFVHELIEKRLERHLNRIDQLRDEIEWLEKLKGAVPQPRSHSAAFLLPPFMPYWPRGRGGSNRACC
jgi:hypothetical protein